MRPSKRSLGAVTAVLGALAIAAPISSASAATTPGLLPGWPTPGTASAFDWSAFVPNYAGAPWSFTGSSYAHGPTVVNDLFNGATVVQVVNGGAASSVLGSP
jgi:hypothetical protein